MDENKSILVNNFRGAGKLDRFPHSSPINMPLSEFVDIFLKAATHSRNTVRAYRTAAGLFYQFMSYQYKDHLIELRWYPLAQSTIENRRTVWEFRGKAAVLRLITPQLIDEFVNWMEDGQPDEDGIPSTDGSLSSSTINVRTRAIGTMLSIARREQLLTQEQIAQLNVRRFKRREKREKQHSGRRLTKNEAKMLRNAVITEGNTRIEMATEQSKSRAAYKTKRDLLLIDLMLFMGLRLEETCSIRYTDFSYDDGRWAVQVHGKGGTEVVLKLHNQVLESLNAWMNVCNEYFQGKSFVLGESNSPLLLNLRKGGHIVPDRAIDLSLPWKIVTYYAKKAGIFDPKQNKRLSNHDLRRTAGRLAYEATGDIFKVQQMLRHANPETTMLYIGVKADYAGAAIDSIDLDD